MRRGCGARFWVGAAARGARQGRKIRLALVHVARGFSALPATPSNTLERALQTTHERVTRLVLQRVIIKRTLK